MSGVVKTSEMKKSELAGITLVAITLISLNVFKGQEKEQFHEETPRTPVPAIVRAAKDPLVVEKQTSSDWTTGEPAFKSYDY